MSRDNIIKEMLPGTVCMTPKGFVSNELSPEDFRKCCYMFFEKILEISKADITEISGYGEFEDDCRTKYPTCREFLTGTFTENEEGYWYHWKEMFETTVLDRDIFNKYYRKMEERIDYCEGHRYLVNNNTFFRYMITDGKTKVGFPDWSRSGICDFLLDFAIMDLNKPYLKIPELFFRYCKENSIEIENFKERFLCMAYYKGIDTLRWHASIDDTESCDSIVKSLSELEDRIMAL
jgi:hygromycin-B 4-O-kinase